MYESTDMGLCAALVTLGERMEGKEMDGRQIIFSFEDSPRLRRMIEDYFQDTLMVKANKYNAAIRSIKAQITQANRNTY